MILRRNIIQAQYHYCRLPYLDHRIWKILKYYTNLIYTVWIQPWVKPESNVAHSMEYVIISRQLKTTVIVRWPVCLAAGAAEMAPRDWNFTDAAWSSWGISDESRCFINFSCIRTQSTLSCCFPFYEISRYSFPSWSRLLYPGASFSNVGIILGWLRVGCNWLYSSLSNSEWVIMPQKRREVTLHLPLPLIHIHLPPQIPIHGRNIGASHMPRNLQTLLLLRIH